MGYYVSLYDADFVIPADKVDAALSAIKSLNAPEYNHLKVNDPPRYPWMEPDWDKGESLTLEDVLRMLSFEPEQLPDGGVVLHRFDAKWSEHIPFFLSALARFVADGSYLTFSGEDSFDLWKYVVEDGVLVEHRAEITWVRAR